MSFLFSPLEQFEVRMIQPLSFLGFFDISITVVTLYLVLIFLTSLFFFNLSLYKATIIPNNWQSITELVYEFVLDIVKQQAGRSGLIYFPILFVVFIFILFSNLLGLMPFGFTVTGHIIVTWTLAFSFNLAWLFLGFTINGLSFFKLFIPSGITFKPLLIIIFFIEVISYSIRSFSLSVRLFANMMAGHALLHILASFGVGFSKSKYFFLAIMPFVLILAVLVLEFGIAVIQAYVFVILLSIYLNDALHPGH